MKQLIIFTLLLFSYLNLNAQWKDIGISGGPAYRPPVVFNGALYTASFKGLYKSTDLGISWQKIAQSSPSSPYLNGNSYVSHLISTGEFLYWKTDYVILRSSNGLNWDTILTNKVYVPVFTIGNSWYEHDNHWADNRNNMLWKYGPAENKIYDIRSSSNILSTGEKAYFITGTENTDFINTLSENGEIIKNQIYWTEKDSTSNTPLILCPSSNGLILYKNLKLYELDFIRHSCESIYSVSQSPDKTEYIDSLIYIKFPEFILFSCNSGKTWTQLTECDFLKHAINGISKFNGRYYGTSINGISSSSDGISWSVMSNSGLPADIRTAFLRDSRLRFQHNDFRSNPYNQIYTKDKSYQFLPADSLWYYSEHIRLKNGRTYRLIGSSRKLVYTTDLVKWDTLPLNIYPENVFSNGIDKLYLYYTIENVNITKPPRTFLYINNGTTQLPENYNNVGPIFEGKAAFVNDYIFTSSFNTVAFKVKQFNSVTEINRQEIQSVNIIAVNDKVYTLVAEGNLLSFDFNKNIWEPAGNKKILKIFDGKTTLLGVDWSGNVVYLKNNEWIEFSDGLPESLIVNDIKVSENTIILSSDKGVFERSDEEIFLNINDKKSQNSGIQTSLYPNPATGNVYIQTENEIIKSVKILSLKGETVNTSIIIKGGEATIDLQKLHGIYTVITETENASDVKKLVVY
jgi:hypothetical protein